MNIYHLAEITYPLRNVVAKICNALIHKRNVKVTIVFGMSRSGTTFLGESLALNKESSIYIHEPVKYMMQTRHNSLKGNKPEYWDYIFQEQQIPRKVHYLVCTLIASLIMGRIKSGGSICVKPITMVDSMQEVANTIDCSIVYISRHPCGWAESIKRQTLADPEHHLENHFDEAKLREMGNKWGKQNKKIKELFANHQKWKWVVFEDLCKEPTLELRKLYEYLHIDWNKNVQEILDKITHTPSDDFYGINRRSQDEADKWKNALSSDEIEAIRKGCAKHITGIYENF